MERISTGMPALDEILHGGLPRDSFIMIAGVPGTGKTTLTLSMLFANASPKQPVVYFTTMSEPAAKVLKYQQEFAFFDKEKFNTSVVFVDIGAAIRQEGLEEVIEVIRTRMEEVKPHIVAIDSFKVLADAASDKFLFRRFCYDLAVLLSVYECTALLVGEYAVQEMSSRPEFSIADGVISLDIHMEEALSLRVLRVHKMRGTAFREGDHSFIINNKGIAMFPRLRVHELPGVAFHERPSLREASPKEKPIVKVPTGIPSLDRMLNGGFNKGFSTMIAGSAGTGKTTFALHFLYEGLKRGEQCLLVGMEESTTTIVKVAAGYGIRLAKYVDSGQLTRLNPQTADLNMDQIAQEIREIVTTQKVTRVAFDGIGDIQANVTNARSLRSYVYALVTLFESQGITSLWTNIIENTFGEFKISEGNLSVVVDGIILLRYVEVDSHIAKAISVLKMRGTEQDKTLRRYEISAKGIEIGGPFEGYGHVMLGTPTTPGGGGTLPGYPQEVSERVRAGESTNPGAQGKIAELARERRRRG